MSPKDELPEVTAENVDIARWAFGAYQAHNEKPVRVEHTTYGPHAGERAGQPLELIFGQVNPCRYGDQCEGHACYCNHPEGPRKCRFSWYTGGETPDTECPIYKPNPYWQQAESGDFHDSRALTIAKMREAGLVEDEPLSLDEEGDGSCLI